MCNDHTPEPVHSTDYLGWHEWARKMGRTHRQIKCEGCGLYKIWVPRKKKDKRNERDSPRVQVIEVESGIIKL